MINDDVDYCFGIMLWELYHIDQKPFEEFPELLKFTYKLEDAIVDKNLRPTIRKGEDGKEGCPLEYANLIRDCWAVSFHN